MVGMTDEFRTVLGGELHGSAGFADIASLLANPWLQFHTGPPGPHGILATASDTRRVQVSLGPPAVDASHLVALTCNAQVVLNNWNAPTQDTESVLTNFVLWSGDQGTNASPLMEAPLGGQVWRACSVSSTNDTLTSAGHGLTNGNLVEVLAAPLQDPTMPGFTIRPHTRYIVTASAGASFKLLQADGTTPAAVGVDGSCMVVRAIRHTADMGDNLVVPVGMVSVPLI